MFTVVMGAPLMRVLRKSYGPKAYWIFGLVVSVLLWLLKAEPLAVFVASVWMTLGAYGELEQRGLGWWVSGLLSVLLGAAVGGLGAYQVMKVNGIHTIADMQVVVDEFAQKVQSVNPEVKIETTQLLQQIPSAIVVILVIALGLGLIFEKAAFSWLRLPREKMASQLKLLDYRVPDFMIWVAMSAFLLTMVSFGVKAIAVLALNVVNIAVVLYFFQGLAVLEVFLKTIKAGFLMRVLAYIILIGQLSLLLSIIGLVDYWVDFRGRLKNLKARQAKDI
jgi:hypothetical protein